MFSFLQASSQPEKEPENTPDVHKDTSSDISMTSSFGFMNQELGEEDPNKSSSSFSFMQHDSEPIAATTGFSFMSDAAGAEDTTAEVASSFSFMTGDNLETTPSVPTVSNDKDLATLLSLNQPVLSGSVDNSGLGQAGDLVDLKLNKTSVKTVKKKKKSSKVGFGRDDDDEAEDRQPQQPSMPVPVQQELQSHFGFMSSEANPISSIEVDAGTEYGPALSGGPSDVLDQSPHSARTDLPPTPPPPRPVLNSQPLELGSPHPSHENLALMVESAKPVAAALMESQTAFHLQATGTVDTAQPPAPLQLGAVEPQLQLNPITVPEPLPAMTHAESPAPVLPLSVPVPASAQPCSPSPAESSVQKLERKSRDIQAQLTSALNELSRIHSSALAGQARFRAEIEAEVSGIQNARALMQAGEEEQTRLALEEDFEKAEALNVVIHGRDAEVRAREAALTDLRNSVRLLEETFAHERSECVSNFVRATNSLHATREQLQVALSQQQSSSERQWDLEDSRIRAELERIGLEKGHFEREEQALAGDSERTEEAIQTQTGDLSARKMGLEASMDSLSEEIRLLQEQLSLKLAAQQVLAADLSAVDGKIGEVRRKYDRQLQRISDRQSALQLSKAECLEEENLVLREQQALEAAAAARKQSKQAAAAWASSLELDIEIADVLLAELKAPLGTAPSSTPMASIKAVDSVVEDAASSELRRNLEAITYLMNKKRSIAAELQTQRADLSAESRRLADLVPVFEAEKKTHAAAKRFKEAAAAAKELKEVQIAKETVDARTEEVNAAATATAAEIAQLEDQETATSVALRDAHRQGDIARFELLLIRAKKVRSMQRVIVSKQRGQEGTNALPVGDYNIGCMVLQFLATELDAVLKEALVLKNTHALPQDVVWTQGEEEQEEGEENASRRDGADPPHGAGEQPCAEVGPFSLEADTLPITSESGDGAIVSTSELDFARDEENSAPTDSANENSQGGEATGLEGGCVTADENTSAAAQAEREARLVEAKGLARRVAELSAQLDQASEEEEYELAAELFEEVTSCTEALNKMLEELQCSKEEL